LIVNLLYRLTQAGRFYPSGSSQSAKTGSLQIKLFRVQAQCEEVA